MNAERKICAVLPVKDTRQAKHRLAGILSEMQRRQLALAMVADVLEALAAVSGLAGILIVTDDPAMLPIASRHGARVSSTDARAGHTAAVAAGARQLAAEGFGMLSLPGDIPLVQPSDITLLLEAHGRAPAFTIVPARDEQGSNAVLCSPPEAVPLRFGENSFFPHLDTARACGIEPKVVRLPRIALDIDTPGDLALFIKTSSRTRAGALLGQWNAGESLGAISKA